MRRKKAGFIMHSVVLLNLVTVGANNKFINDSKNCIFCTILMTQKLESFIKKCGLLDFGVGDQILFFGSPLGYWIFLVNLDSWS